MVLKLRSDYWSETIIAQVNNVFSSFALNTREYEGTAAAFIRQVTSSQ